MRVACVLTTTPLARQHAHRLATNPSRPREIPWARFDRERYAAGALAIASQSARSLATGEYGAVTLFAHAASALAFHCAPFDLIATAARIPADEIRHAEYACRMAALCAGTDLTSLDLEVDDAILTARCAPIRNLEDLDIFMLELPAVSETLATALLDACREGATDPVARAFLANIVRDEVHHARLGWYYLAWRAPQWSDAERQRLANRAGEIVMEVDRPRMERATRDARRVVARRRRANRPRAKRDADEARHATALGTGEPRVSLASACSRRKPPAACLRRGVQGGRGSRTPVLLYGDRARRRQREGIGEKHHAPYCT